jgi:hypothetical protein
MKKTYNNPYNDEFKRISQNVMTPVWKLGRLSVLGVSTDAKI